MCFSYTFVVRFQYSIMIMMIGWFVSDNGEEKTRRIYLSCAQRYPELLQILESRILVLQARKVLESGLGP